MLELGKYEFGAQVSPLAKILSTVAGEALNIRNVCPESMK
jgi:hypothetical protein